MHLKFLYKNQWKPTSESLQQKHYGYLEECRNIISSDWQMANEGSFKNNEVLEGYRKVIHPPVIAKNCLLRFSMNWMFQDAIWLRAGMSCGHIQVLVRKQSFVCVWHTADHSLVVVMLGGDSWGLLHASYPSIHVSPFQHKRELFLSWHYCSARKR